MYFKSLKTPAEELTYEEECRGSRTCLDEKEKESEPIPRKGEKGGGYPHT